MAAPNGPSAAGAGTGAAEPSEEAAAGLPEFVLERVERGRRLLVEDVRYEGSVDLQDFVTCMGSVEAYVRLLPPEGAARWQAVQAEQQAMVAYLHSCYHNMQSLTPFTCAPHFRRLEHAAQRHRIAYLAGLPLAGLPAPASKLLCEMVQDALQISHGAGRKSGWPTPDLCNGLAEAAQRYVRWDASTAAAAAALEAHQRNAAFQPLLTAAQLQLLGTVLALQHSENCGITKFQKELAGEPHNLHPRQPGPAGLAACRRLLQLQPDSAAAHNWHSVFLQMTSAPSDEVLAALQAGLEQAEATRRHSFVAVLAVQAALGHATGARGGVWWVADVQPLVVTATRALKHWRRWGLRPVVDAFT